MPAREISAQELEDEYQRLRLEAEAGGYHLNPDAGSAKDLIRGLMMNEARYGYGACPCRLASGVRDDDLDIMCPCDYRDPDLTDHGSCYCALYVSGEISSGERAPASIPERRPPAPARKQRLAHTRRQRGEVREDSLSYPVWRCAVCGYLCARDAPPEQCPICKAKRERFERFM